MVQNPIRGCPPWRYLLANGRLSTTWTIGVENNVRPAKCISKNARADVARAFPLPLLREDGFHALRCERHTPEPLARQCPDGIGNCATGHRYANLAGA